MNRIAKQLIAALVSTFLALGVSIGFAGASSDMGGHEGDHKSKGSGVSQPSTQKAYTDQSGDSNQDNVQFIPVNLNASSLGTDGDMKAPTGKDAYGPGGQCSRTCDDHHGKPSHGGDVTQKNEASPTNVRVNKAFTGQFAHQDQDVTVAHGPGGSHPCNDKCGDPKGDDKKHRPDGHHPKDDKNHRPDGKHDRCDKCDHPEAKSPHVSQDLDQSAWTDQSGNSNQENWQILPINVNAPISVLSVGSNDGEVRQSNEASPTNVRENEAFTGQIAGQDQAVSQPASGGSDGAVSQDGDQSSFTDQSGDSNQTNVQVLPINVNAPISVLSHGSNNDDVSQSNEASPTNYRSNEAGTFQVIDQSQTVGSLT